MATEHSPIDPPDEADAIAPSEAPSARRWIAPERAMPQRSYANTVVLLPQAEHTRYATDPNMIAMDEISDDAVRPTQVSPLLIVDIVLNDAYFSHLRKIAAERTIDRFNIGYNIGNDVGGSNAGVSIASAARVMQNMAAEGAFDGNDEARRRVDEISRLTSLEQMNEDYTSLSYQNTIDGIAYNIPAKQLIAILLCDEASYDQFLSEGDGSGIPKEHLAYALRQFVRGNRLFARYVIPDAIRDRYVALAGHEHVDFESVNTFTSMDDMEVVGEAVMDQALRAHLLEGMPEDLNDLERAIWLYLKMCKTFTYDAESYAYDTDGPAMLKHQDVARVGTITQANNSLVCYEFSVILEKLLQEMGIGFSTQYGSMDEPNRFYWNAGYYGEGHAYCRARAGMFIVDFDSVHKVVGGDMAQVKLHQPTNGIVCRNRNEHTQQEFNTTLENVSRRFYASVEHGLPLDTSTSQDQGTGSHEQQHLGVDHNVSAWFEAISRGDLEPVDAITRALLLRHEMLGDASSTVAVSIVRENIAGDTPAARPVVIIAAEEAGSADRSGVTSYFYFAPPEQVTPLTRDEVEARFNTHRYEYLVGQEAHPVPGISPADTSPTT